MAFLTIITPTYNRAHTLAKCYHSLLRQTCFDFEWIIVDDGSTDNTQDVISDFSSEFFSIIKLYKENGGKHTALNAAHPHIHGDYIMILDSDDYLVDTAVCQVMTAWERFKDKTDVGIITFLKGADVQSPSCTVKDYDTPVDIMTYPRICKQSSDCCEVIRTKLFKKFPFPEFSGEIFVSECALWDRVSFVSKCVYIESVIYICEYLEGGLTKSGRAMRVRNPRGGMFTSEIRMDPKGSFKQRIKNGILYTCYGCFAKISPWEMSRRCRSEWLMWLCLPFGWGMYTHWNKIYIKQ